LHFGMTGDLKYYQDPEDAPKHERFVIIFKDGFRLGFDCPRKFARILSHQRFSTQSKTNRRSGQSLRR